MRVLFRFTGVCAVLFLLSACGGASKKAHEKADAAMYKSIEYENASIQGPPLVVLPGSITSRHGMFMDKVKENNIKDFAEIELSKANFSLVENADKQPMFDELALAANLGDGQALRVFKNKCVPNVKCFLVFDIIEAEPVAWEAKGGSGEVAGTLIELGFLIANKGKKSSMGTAIGATVSSIKSYDYKTTWNVAMRYKLVDAMEGKEICSNEIREQHVVESQLKSAVGVTNAETGSMTMDTLIQRLVQRAVQEIDKQHKQAMNSLVAPSGKKKETTSSNAEKKLAEEYKKKINEQSKKQDQQIALDVVKAWAFAYSTIDTQTLLFLSSPIIHERIAKEMGTFLKTPESNPNWRDKFTIDISNLNYEMDEYSPERCKVKMTGNIKFGEKGKEKEYLQTEVKEVVKEDGVWKIASLDVKKAN